MSAGEVWTALFGPEANTLTVPVPDQGAWNALAATMATPGAPLVSHQIKIGNYYITGQWVVIGARNLDGKLDIALAKLED